MARVYAVASAKGGVGKTTTTANLSATLAAAGYAVAVVDGDIGMANLGNMLGITDPDATLHDVLAGDADVADATYEGPHGMSVVPGETELAAFGEAVPTRLGRVVGSFADRDFVFVDTGAGLSHATALPLGLADRVLLVSTNERDALGDTEKTRKLAGQLGAVVEGVVLTRVEPGSSPTDPALLQAPVLGSVPEDPALTEASRRAVPITIHDPDAPAAAALRGIAGELADGPVRPPERTHESMEAAAETGDADQDEPTEEADEPAADLAGSTPVDGPVPDREPEGVDEEPVQETEDTAEEPEPAHETEATTEEPEPAHETGAGDEDMSAEAEAAAREFQEAIREATSAEADERGGGSEPAESPELEEEAATTDDSEPESEPESEEDAEEAPTGPESEEDAEEAPTGPESEEDAEEAPTEPESEEDAEEAPTEPESEEEAEEAPTEPEGDKVVIPEAETDDDSVGEEAVPFEADDEEEDAPLVEEQPDDDEDEDSGGFLSRLFR